MYFFYRWRKFSHLEPSCIFTNTEERTPSLSSLAGMSTHTSRANSFLSTCNPHYSSHCSISPQQRQSRGLSTTSTLNHYSRRLSLRRVTEHLINSKRRQSCMPTLAKKDKITRQKSVPCTIKEVSETPSHISTNAFCNYNNFY